MGPRNDGGVVLDAGAIIGLARGDRRLIALLHGWRSINAEIRVPMVVLAETTRSSGPREARLNMILALLSPHRPLDEPTARRAGALLAAAGGNNTIDALVAAEALACAPSVLCTTDPDDMTTLVAGERGVRVLAV